MIKEEIYLDNRDIRNNGYIGAFVYVAKTDDVRYSDRTTLLEALKKMKRILEQDLKSGSFHLTIKERIVEVDGLISLQESKLEKS